MNLFRKIAVIAAILGVVGCSGGNTVPPASPVSPTQSVVGSLSRLRATPEPSPSPAPLFTAPIAEVGGTAAPYGINVCPASGQTLVSGYGCIPVSTAKATILGGPLVPGMTVSVFGSLPSGTISGSNPVVATEVAVPGATPVPTTAPSALPTAIFTGPVTELGGSAAPYGFNSCPASGQTFISGYGCLPVSTATATIVNGPLAVGETVSVYGTVPATISQSTPIVATQVVVAGGSTPSPSPTTNPTTAPTSASVSLPANGYAWPASFVPFGPSSPWNARIINPTYTSDSAAIIAAQFPGAGLNEPVRNNPAGQWDQAHPIYFASNSDPLINVNCSGGCQGIPSQIHIPAHGLFGQSQQDDSHIGVVQPNGEEYDMYCWNGNTTSCGPQQGGTWSSGQSVSPGYGADCGNVQTGSGIQAGPTDTTAGGACESAGLLNPNELAAGVINHALFIVVNCTNPGGVPPAHNQNTNNCPNGIGPKLGYRLYYDVPDTTTNANTALKPWEKAILNALHDYGAYVMDDFGGTNINGGGAMFQTESGEPSYAYGVGDQWAQMSSQGWSSANVAGDLQPRWFGGDQDSNGNWAPPGVNMNQHLHYINYP